VQLKSVLVQNFWLFVVVVLVSLVVVVVVSVRSFFDVILCRLVFRSFVFVRSFVFR
jgi:hypothetical protein